MDRSSTTTPAIPDYELIERIGSGAYGEVWLARNLATGAQRAVKIVYRATFTDERPFNREFEGIKKFEAISHSHPSQLSLFHVGRNEAAGYFYYVMELADEVGRDVPGAPREYDSAPDQPKTSSVPKTPSAMPNEKCSMLNAQSPPVSSYTPHTLRSDLQQTRLPAARLLEIALALTEALSHLHQNNLIHRDVKPSNIIFIQGRPKLADIGLVTDDSDSRSIVGTEGYLAPEGPGSAAADIYALGKVLYEALTGLDRRRFPELPEELRTWADRREVIELNEIVLKACAKESARRYQSAEAMLGDLRLLKAGRSVQLRRTLGGMWSIGWKLAAVAAIGAMVFSLSRRKESADSRPAWEKAGTTNQAAWQASQRALQMINTYTTAGLSNAIGEWERATKLDPNYAAGWSVLSVTMAIAVNEGHVAGTNYLPRGKRCAEKAIALAPKFGPSYGALALCDLSLDHDFAAAETLFRKSIELDPENSNTRINFAWELLYVGRLAEAGEMWESVRKEAPEKASSYLGLGVIASLNGDEAKAGALMEEAIVLAPDRPLWRRWRGDFRWAVGLKQAAAEDWLEQVGLGGFLFLDRKADAAALRQILNERGPDAFLGGLIALCEERQRQGRFVSGLDLGRLHAQAGNVDEALRHLEVAFEERRGTLRSVKMNPAFHLLREEPRFKALLRRMGLAL